MVSCVIMNCKNTSSKISKLKNGITFHRFPQDKHRRRQWESAVNREHWSSTPHSAVCSDHFEPQDFFLTESGLRRLSMDAIPTINISPCQEQEMTISHQEPIDVSPLDTKEVIKLKYRVKRLEEVAESRKKRLMVERQINNRLKKKLEEMKRMVQNLVRSKEEKNGR